MTKQLKVLISCGPTRESIDPVRFISNLSTGTFGFELADLYSRMGHRVTLVHGPIAVPKEITSRKIPFETSEDLNRILKREVPKNDILFMTAAVSDFRPKKIQRNKIKKKKGSLKLEFVQNKDVLKSLAPLKKNRVYVGFSVESRQVRELMELYARSWRDLGTLVEERFGGSFLALVDAAGGSAGALVRTLLELPLYRDISSYRGLAVPFLKRAQLSVADLALALPEGLGRFEDLDRLTGFADNLVPHVLRLDGILHYAPALLARIEHEELIPWGSPDEVEIRACAVHAIELLTAQLESRSVQLAPRQLDSWLWQRGGEPAYKARPRHRTRCPFY